MGNQNNPDTIVMERLGAERVEEKDRRPNQDGPDGVEGSNGPAQADDTPSQPQVYPSAASGHSAPSWQPQGASVWGSKPQDIRPPVAPPPLHDPPQGLPPPLPGTTGAPHKPPTLKIPRVFGGRW